MTLAVFPELYLLFANSSHQHEILWSNKIAYEIHVTSYETCRVLASTAICRAVIQAPHRTGTTPLPVRTPATANNTNFLSSYFVARE
jgi:hypothetical protein